MKRLVAFPPEKLIYVCAPAGYGKSVAAHLWVAQAPRGAVVSLDEYDNTLAVFCRRFCAALLALSGGDAQVAEMAGHEAFASAPDEYTVHALAALPADTVGRLVVDDLHCLSGKAVLRLLARLLARLPAGVQAMALSRETPPEELADLVVKGRVSLVTEEDLMFTAEEVRALYAGRGIPLTKAQARAVCEMTQGWAIGINALLLSGQRSPDSKLLMEHLESYLRTQIWDGWDEETRDFMLATAVEDELTPSLCVALTGREDSAERLAALVKSSAFIIQSGDDVYHFHQLFRRFLLGQLEADPDLARAQTKKAGLWYMQEGRYFKAIDAFLRCGDEELVLSCINEIARSGKNEFEIDKIVPVFRHPAVRQIVDKHEYLLSMRAWVAFLEGWPEEMERDSDRIYARAGEIIKTQPSWVYILMYQRCIDYRVPMRQFAQEALQAPRGAGPVASSGTVTQNMPLFHRSARDLSEFAGDDMEQDVDQLRQAIGILFGREEFLFEKLLLAGLHFERGELTEAHSIALEATSDLKDDYASESKFCAMVLYIHILRAQWRFDRADLMVVDMERMIENDQAFFLTYNCEAFLCRCRLENGDTEAARQWIEQYGTDPLGHLSFQRLYGHFATARAHIALGNYDKAIVLLRKCLELGRTYRRPLDIIEAEVLLAIAFWQKKRGFQKEALAYLEDAILVAHPYGYTQAFAGEGAELANMLFRLQNRANRKDYTGPLPGSFVRMLHIQAATQAGHARGLTGGQAPRPVKYTAQQKQVMRLLCAGYSYRQIAEEMNIKFSTVRSHIELIYKKLDVPNEMEAVQKIREQGILEDE